MELKVSELKVHLYEILDNLEKTHDEITVIRNGKRRYKLTLIPEKQNVTKFGSFKDLYSSQKDFDFTEPMDADKAFPKDKES
jgi:hypothetical protein